MTQIRLVLGDITKLAYDAIVNAANRSLLGGGGVDGAIHRAAGPELLEACRLLNGCETGQAKITKAFRLPAKYVIHTVGPIWNGGNMNEEKLLELCYHNSLKLGKEHGCQTIAFPNISTGVYRFPKQKAAHIALKTVADMLQSDSTFQEVAFVCFDDENFRIYKELIPEYFPEGAIIS